MALNDILSSATSGLAAAQAGLRAVSNNIANVGVTGYARQRVDLSAGVTSGQVNGVVVGQPTRVADKFLEATVYRRAGDYGRAEASSTYLDRLQALLGQPGSSTGLPARLDSISKSAIAMTGSQASEQTTAVFNADVQDAITSMQQMQEDVAGLRGDVEAEVGYSVDKINSLLSRIHDLNGTVASATGLGKDAGGAADQRMNAIQELSGLMAVTVREQPDGRVSIETTTGQPLLDKKLRQLSYPTAGGGTSQPTYPSIEIRFANADGSPGVASGDKIDGAAIGGKLGGLIDLRDRALPAFTDQLGTLFGGLAQSLNKVANAGSTVPPPASLDGRQTGLVGGDRLGFTGAATFAVTKSDGTLVASKRIDFDALGPNATIDDMVSAINIGLGGSATGVGGAATASFVDGKLKITANGSGNGVAIGQDATSPSARGDVGVSQFFGLNDMIRSDSSSLVPSGFALGDKHGFAAGETTQMVLRDAMGRVLANHTLEPAAGGTFGDLVDDLNASPLGDFGDFALDDKGRLQFQPGTGSAGANLSVPADSTNRFDTGRTFSSLMSVTGASSGLSDSQVRADILSSPGRLPLAQLQTNAAVGTKALGAGDLRNATAFVNQLDAAVDFGKGGTATLERFSSLFLGRVGLEASQADSRLTDSAARMDDAVNRRDSFAGVNIDEELAQMVVLQNSYSAAARVISTASEMYDTLLNMV
ncbi:flagellar hook-associated protein FlgK [Sphingomonas xinjiangensis]|uniref:Flagellar hook-associated protein 1 n=1 Tax=Sphingomonas xinjiangensis TaxID=643568 RepID=A0A840YQD5_9SPHN|nr:flagellar hook-associated protein FlgK [Sphingomonas xinjiangensis]MBB5710782.1 flagellar hook-associated protein 1 FlgK [Sphingomonas xinjiangensis]